MTSIAPSHAADPRIADVLSYWLGSAHPDNAGALACKNLWFIKSDATDDQIRERFGAWSKMRWPANWTAGPARRWGGWR